MVSWQPLPGLPLSLSTAKPLVDKDGRQGGWMGWHSTHSLQKMGTRGSLKARPAEVPDMQQAGTADP